MVVPRWVTEGLLEELQDALGIPVGVVEQQITREVTPETQAWQEEIHTWDTLQETAQRMLEVLGQVGKGWWEAHLHPCH